MSDVMGEQGDIQAAIEAGRSQIYSVPTAIDRLHAFVVPGVDGSKIELVDLDQYGAAPRHKEATVTLRDVESFIEYVKRHRSDGSVVLADIATGKMSAILDHHEGAEGDAGWRKHVALLDRPYTIQWQRWMSAAGKPISQYDFANFLEDRLTEIVEPDGADLIEITQEFKASKTLRFRTQKRLSNGQTQVEYVEEIEGGGGTARSIAMPERILIRVKPYRDSAEIAVLVRLRWSLADQAVRFTLVMPDSINDELATIWEGAIDDVRRTSGAPVFLGEAR